MGFRRENYRFRAKGNQPYSVEIDFFLGRTFYRLRPVRNLNGRDFILFRESRDCIPVD